MSTIAKYIDKVFFDSYYPVYGPDPLDLLGEKFYYGKVDTRLNSVYIPDSQAQFRLGQLSANETVFAVNFVAEAFNAMKSYFIRAAASRRLCREGLYVNLEAKKGWTSSDERFRFHQEKYFQIFHNFIKSSGKVYGVKNFDDYLRLLLSFAVEFGHSLPITRTGFIRSKYYSFYSTGLIIDLAVENYNDTGKRFNYISDPNYNFFRKAAKRHGFLVDKYAPWRLIADISSTRMQEDFMVPEPIFYNKETSQIEALEEAVVSLEPGSTVIAPEGQPLDFPDYGLKLAPGTASNYFETYCIKSHILDIFEMKNAVINYYNLFVGQNPTQKKKEVGTSDCKPVLTELFTRSPLEGGDLDLASGSQEFENYSDAFWVDTYLKIRLAEASVVLHKSRLSQMLKMNRILLKNYGMQKAIANINRSVIIEKGRQSNPKFCQNYNICGDIDLLKKKDIDFSLTSPQQYGYTTTTIPTITVPPPTSGGGMGGGY